MLKTVRAISSVGLERCLDRAEVTGSNPVWLTNKKPDTEGCPAFFIEPSGSLLPAWFYEKRRSAAPAAYGFRLGTRAPFWFFCRKAKNPVEACFQLGSMKKDAVQRQLPTAFVWVQEPRFGSFAERQKIQ